MMNDHEHVQKLKMAINAEETARNPISLEKIKKQPVKLEGRRNFGRTLDGRRRDENSARYYYPTTASRHQGLNLVQLRKNRAKAKAAGHARRAHRIAAHHG